jgi:hypothetical protein
MIFLVAAYLCLLYCRDLCLLCCGISVQKKQKKADLCSAVCCFISAASLQRSSLLQRYAGRDDLL